jgi:hypothetical protein
MKTLVTIFWSVMFTVFAVQQGVCQQATETKSSAESTATGVIKTITRGFSFVISVPKESGEPSDLSFNLPKEVKITMDGNAAKEDDLRMGKMVVVDYTTRKAASGTNDASAGKATVRAATNISIIFNDNPPPVDKQTAQQQASAKIPAEYIGSWTSVVQDSTQTVAVAANHIKWTRDIHDPQEVYNSDTNRVDAKGDISFDTKIYLTSDVSTNTTIFLKLRAGRLFLRSGPALVDLGNVKLSNPGEERVFFRDRTSASSGNKPSPAQ